jgi:hypothetical protein
VTSRVGRAARSVEVQTHFTSQKDPPGPDMVPARTQWLCSLGGAALQALSLHQGGGGGHVYTLSQLRDSDLELPIGFAVIVGGYLINLTYLLIKVL